MRRLKRRFWEIRLNEDTIDNVMDTIDRNLVAAKVTLKLEQEQQSSDNIRLTHSQAVRLVHLVKSRNTGVEWSSLELNFCSECSHLLFCTTQVAPSFTQIGVRIMDRTSHSVGHLPLSTAYSIYNALQYGNCLQEIWLSHCIIRQDRMELLCQGIQSTSCPLRRLSLWKVECDISAFLENDNHESEAFRLALKKNTTLEEVELKSSFMRDQDVTLIHLFYKMSSGQPPRWTTLNLDGSNLGRSAQIQGQTMQLLGGLTGMLSHQHCSIVELNLDNCFNFASTGRDILRSLMLGLQDNTSIKVLHLSQNAFNAEDLRCIMDGIAECQNLHQIDLDEDDPAVYREHENNLSWLINSRLMPPHPPTQIRKLMISDHLPNRKRLEDDDSTYSHDDDYEICDEEFESIFLRLLAHNPLLCDLGEGLSWKWMPRVVELLDLNQCIGFLRRLPREQGHVTDTSPLSRIPLSLWPMVLERTNKYLEEHPARCANVVHQILMRGPGLLVG